MLKTKRFLSFLLVIVLIISVTQVPVFAADTSPLSDNLQVEFKIINDLTTPGKKRMYQNGQGEAFYALSKTPCHRFAQRESQSGVFHSKRDLMPSNIRWPLAVKNN